MTKERVSLGGIFTIKCYGPDGKLKWKDTAKNKVVNEGLNHMLDVLFVSATSQVDPWYVGLTEGSPTPAAGDTLASHGGWTEENSYSEGSRQTYTDVRTNQTVSNAAAKASFSINANGQTIGGAFLCSASTGTSGTLLCVAAFSGGNKSADSGDTLEVTYEFSAASST